MKKQFILLLSFLYLSTTLKASNDTNDSIKTVYQDGQFKTEYKIKVKASELIASEVANDLLKDFHHHPDNLFNWALKDLGLQETTKNDVIFILKSSITDTKTGITHGIFDIIVPHFTTFNNVKVNAIVSRTNYNNGKMKVTSNIIYSSLLLKNALGILNIIRLNKNELFFITNVSIKFGWFFNIFITRKRYKSIVEWRIKKFTENLKNECERRQDVLSNN